MFGSIRQAMSISAQPSAWKLEQIAEPVAEALDRPGQHFLRLLVVELDRDFAGFEFVHQMIVRALRFHR